VVVVSSNNSISSISNMLLYHGAYQNTNTGVAKEGLSVLKVGSRQGAIQIHVYLTLPYLTLGGLPTVTRIRHKNAIEHAISRLRNPFKIFLGRKITVGLPL